METAQYHLLQCDHLGRLSLLTSSQSDRNGLQRLSAYTVLGMALWTCSNLRNSDSQSSCIRYVGPQASSTRGTLVHHKELRSPRHREPERVLPASQGRICTDCHLDVRLSIIFALIMLTRSPARSLPLISY